MHTVINCPKCGEPNTIKLSNAIDELGEVFICNYCNWKFRYVNK